MEKIAVIYWSGTGNTQMMAEAIAEGAGVNAVNVSDVTAAAIAQHDMLMLGCPSMGDEVLEEGEFEPFFTELEGSIGGKRIALFGSYGWGDGEWMRQWEKRVEKAGAELFEKGLIVNETPDAAALGTCRAFGERFAAL